MRRPARPAFRSEDSNDAREDTDAREALDPFAAANLPARLSAGAGCRRSGRADAASAAGGVRDRARRAGPAAALPQPRLGEDLPRPVSLRQLVHLDLRPERHAHVPDPGVRAQRRDRPQRAELRPRPLRGSVRQQGDQGVEPAGLSEGLHIPQARLRPVPGQGSGAAQGLEAVGRRRLPQPFGQPRAADEVQVRRPRQRQLRAGELG